MPAEHHTIDPSIPLKRCTTCGEEKPLTSEYFSWRNDWKPGWRLNCRACISKRGHERYVEKREHIRAYSKQHYAQNADVIKAKEMERYWARKAGTFAPVEKPVVVAGIEDALQALARNERALSRKADGRPAVKKCSKCGREKPWTSEYFHGRNGRKRGLAYRCKDCQRAYTGAVPKKYHEPPSSPLHKRCTLCEQEFLKTPEFFSRKRGTADGLYPWCKPCARLYAKGYSDRWPARYERARQKREALGIKRDRSNESVYIATRKARRLALPDTLTTEEWEYCLQYWSFACAVCGRQPGLFNLTIGLDHWIPFASPQCPGHIATNVLPLCHGKSGCNNEKHTRDAEEWLIGKLGKRKAAKKLYEIQEYFKRLSA